MTEVTCVLEAKAELGECPVWSAEEQALYWIDIHAPALHRLDPETGETRTWEMPQRIGSFGLRENGGAVGAPPNWFPLLVFGNRKPLLPTPPPHQLPRTPSTSRTCCP